MSDQMSFYHTALRKTKRRYRKFAFQLLTETSMVNAWTLYYIVIQKEVSMFQFKETLVENLTKTNSSEISTDTNDTLARNVQQMHVLEEASGLMQKVRKH